VEDEDEVFLVAADAGADDVQFGEVTEIFAELDAFTAVRDAVQEAGFHIDEANVLYEPNTPMALDPQATIQVMGFIEKIEDLDDVQNVYSTLEISDEAIAEMEAA
jgi:transcriptional/translational regulatory protein YebC/TACO1